MNPFASLLASPVFQVFEVVFQVMSATAFIWGPVLLVMMAVRLWREYIVLSYIQKKFDFVMLEIKLPRNIEKTPIAMELVLQSLWQGGDPNWYEYWWVGEVRPWFSLEIISVEGSVKFFVRTPSKYKKLIQSHIYAQYPDIEVHESQDYISLAPYLHEKEEWSLWGTEFALVKPDPYPIKTYVDYGLDSAMIKEEQKSDPITSLIEFLGDVGRNQQIWIQILVKQTENRFNTVGSWFGKHDWKDEGKKVIKQLQEKSGGESSKATKRQSDIITAVEKSLAKIGFDCGIRAIYIAKRENYDPACISGIVGGFMQYSSMDLNGFKPKNKTGFSYPWQDYNDIRLNKKKHKMYDAYARRSWFYPPHRRKPFVLNAEELATIYHFPGGVAETPTFTRIESRKGEPPANLPV
jgi:hypothetical protein